jgi:CRISPR-associated protein Csd2
MTLPTIVTDPSKRHDFVLLFDVQDGNPNGDPDAGNLPRVDPETMQGLVTDVCLKRKVRDYVSLTCSREDGMDIYVQHRGILNAQHQRAYDALGLKSKGAKQDRATTDAAREWMCASFYDIRAFGAVMTTGVNCGQVRGPIQLTFARSVTPIVPLDISITRVAVTRAQDAVTADSDSDKGKETEMGRKAMLPYGLYRSYGFINPAGARDTGLSARDLEVFWKALQSMWDTDRSASRGFMACRGLYVFTHDDAVGNAPAHVLLDRVEVEAVDGVAAARSIKDFRVSVDDAELPEGVTLTKLVA